MNRHDNRDYPLLFEYHVHVQIQMSSANNYSFQLLTGNCRSCSVALQAFRERLVTRKIH